MEDLHSAYLTLLEGLSTDLEKLAALAREKTDAVRRDDLMGLNDVMKQEQVVGLSVRGKEQKRLKLLSQLGMENVPLTQLAAHYPHDLLPRAQEVVDQLYRSYGVFHEASEVARSTLEINLHEIEKIIAAHGIDPAQNSVNYKAPTPAEPPKNMKTDFRA